MTELPDTAEIRARYDVYLDVPGNQVIRALCDALDAARAELEGVRASLVASAVDLASRSTEWRARATSAEKTVTYLDKMWACEIDRAQAAEARIAAALVILRQFGFTDTEMAIHALTEGTGQ